MAFIWYSYPSKVSRFFWDRLFLQRASELLSGSLKFITFLLLKALPLVPAVSVKFYIHTSSEDQKHLPKHVAFFILTGAFPIMVN